MNPSKILSESIRNKDSSLFALTDPFDVFLYYFGGRIHHQFSERKEQKKNIIEISDLKERKIFQDIDGKNEISNREITEKFEMEWNSEIGRASCRERV